MFCPRQAVFSVTRNRFRNRKQLARKGVENSSEVVVFYRGHRGPTRNLAGEGFSSPLRQKTGKIRSFWRGKVAVNRPNQTSKQPVFDRFSAVEDAKSRSFRTGFSSGFSGKFRLKRRFIAGNNVPVCAPVPARRGHRASWGGGPSGGHRHSLRPLWRWCSCGFGPFANRSGGRCGRQRSRCAARPRPLRRQEGSDGREFVPRPRFCLLYTSRCV